MTIFEERSGRTQRALKRKSLPGPLSGSDWTEDTLISYNINFAPVDELEHLLVQKVPDLSGEIAFPFKVQVLPEIVYLLNLDRAKALVTACLAISSDNLAYRMFPKDPNAMWLAKLIYLATVGFGKYESAVDDMVLCLLNLSGFNEKNLVSLSRNVLKFEMSNGRATAIADITVLDINNQFRLAVFEDKRKENQLEGEPQLVCEAIAAAQYNRNHVR
ncbi:unnamed protein product [Didymodactylos carnosus]|uniref:Uncharacterized protein n=1 Tax=Didymodactylos carnosus TaxID=1234261 RepID=A0A815S4J1_9BILA|nr:unnamed protein product [Didymodactylos carnosus]CAF4349494.1 unnamed protein product [Didymodactylos carnosus]